MPPQLNNIIALIIGAIIVIAVLPTVVTMGAPTGSATIDPQVNTKSELDSTSQPDNVRVHASTGTGLRFNNETDTVETDAITNVANESWTVCTAAQLSKDANFNDTYTLFAYKNTTILLQYDAGSWAAYYENASGADAIARVPAESPQTGFTVVCGKYNASTNSLYVAKGGNVSSGQPLTTATSTRNVSKTWRGRLDEVRVFGSAVANATLVELANDPIQPLPGTDRIARLMFDEHSSGATPVYFTGGSATVSGPEWVDAVPAPGLSKGTDYRVTTSPFGITIPQGSYLVGAPVAFVSWGGGLVDLLAGFVPIAALLLLMVVFKDEIEAML